MANIVLPVLPSKLNDIQFPTLTLLRKGSNKSPQIHDGFGNQAAALTLPQRHLLSISTWHLSKAFSQCQACSENQRLSKNGNSKADARPSLSWQPFTRLIVLQPSTWLEIARRLFCLASAGAYISCNRKSSLSGGVDIALGDYVGSSPIGVLGPAVVLQGLLAGAATENPLANSASLPMVPHCHAWTVDHFMDCAQQRFEHPFAPVPSNLCS